MSAQFLLAAAQVGTQMFSAITDAVVAEKAARVRGNFERSQIRLRSEAQTIQRNTATLDTLGAQNASLAASGVGGGRTARLLKAQTRRRASVNREFADVQTSNQLVSSQFREDMAQQKAANSILDAVMGGGTDLLNTGQNIGAQTQAMQGPGSGSVSTSRSIGAIPSNPGSQGWA